MKTLLTLLSLILILVQLPFGPSLPEKPEEEKKSPVKGWWEVSYFSVSPNQYSKAGRGVIKVESLGSRSSLFKEVKEKERNFPILSWGWKVSNVVRSAIETKKDRFDAAARMIVIFGKEKGSKMFEGGEPPGLRIEYIWASHLARDHVFEHPGEKNYKVFVLESGEGKVGQWVYEVRNVHKDYKKAFGINFPGVLAIGIQTDTDHSNELVTAYYTEPILKKN